MKQLSHISIYIAVILFGMIFTSCELFVIQPRSNELENEETSIPGIKEWKITTSFDGTRGYHEAETYNGFLYISGGARGSGQFLDDVQYGSINSDGTISSWNTTVALTHEKYEHTMEIYNGKMYIIGGGYNDGSWHYINSVQYSTINTDGTVGSWTTSPNTFLKARKAHQSVVYNGYLYLLGGGDENDYFNDVQYVKINTDGSLGTWQTANSFTTVRVRFASAVYNGYIYIMGGMGTGGTGDFFDDIQYAKINSDGSIGSWDYTSKLPSKNTDFDAVVHNGYLYVIGGNNSLGTLDKVEYAEFKSDGTIGIWKETASLLLAGQSECAVTDNFIFFTGGHDGTQYVNSVYTTEFIQ